MAFAAPAFAHDNTGTNVDTAASGALGAAATDAFAQDLQMLGVGNKDTLTVLTAARLAALVETKDGSSGQEANQRRDHGGKGRCGSCPR